jgi:uncharacterized protein YjbI with pentapeptide repeats
MVRIARLSASASYVWGFLLVTATASAQSVLVQTPAPGQGQLRARGAECFVLTASAIMGSLIDAPLVGDAKAAMTGTLVREFPGKIAMLRVAGIAPPACREWTDASDVAERLTQAKTGHLVTRQPDGSERRIPVSVEVRGTDGFVFARAGGNEQLDDTMRGAALVVNDSPIGMLLSIENGQGRAYQIDDLMRLTAAFFWPATAPRRTTVSDVAAAQAQLDRVVAARDGSMQGQVEAIATLLAAGHQFDNVNWSGVSLPGAIVAKTSLRNAVFHLTDLTKMDARGSDLTDADFRLALLNDASFNQAKLPSIYAGLASAQRSNFESADLTGSNLYASDLRGARFTKANLTDAVLAFADLRGANFDGADLTGAYLGGAIMDASTTFVGATFKDTDLIGASAAAIKLSTAQRAGICRHDDGPKIGQLIGWDFRVIERRTTDRGENNSVLLHEESAFVNFADRWIPMCETPRRKRDDDFTPTMAGWESFGLSESVLRAGERRHEVASRVKTTIDTLEAQLHISRNLQPDPALVKTWTNQVQQAMGQTTPGPTPYIDADTGVLFALQHNITTLDRVDWLSQAWHRFLWELNPEYEISERKAERRSMWPMVFPSLAPWNTWLSQGIGETFKAWTIERSKRTPRLLTVASHIGADRYAGPLRLDFAGIHDSHADEFEKHLRTRAIPVDRAVSIRMLDAVTIFEAGNKERRRWIPVAMLPQARAGYRIPVPMELGGDFRLEVDFTVERVEWFEKRLVFWLVPGEARAIRGDAVVWRGSLTFEAPPAGRR